MKTTVIIYTALVLAGTAAAISFQDNRISRSLKTGDSLRNGNPACCLPDGQCIDKMELSECTALNGVLGYGACSSNWCVPDCSKINIFSTVAIPFVQECSSAPDPNFWLNLAGLSGQYINIDGEGATELLVTSQDMSSIGYGSPIYVYNSPSFPKESLSSTLNVAKMGENVGVLNVYTILDLDPSVIDYGEIVFENDFVIKCHALVDVTGDELLDAIISFKTDNWDWGPSPNPQSYYFYLENISTPEGVACDTDINNDGSTDVTDMLAIIGEWGPCE